MDRTYEDRYAAHCVRAATNQGLDPISAAMAAAGVEYDVEQTGGFCMVLTVRTVTGTYALTTERDDPATRYDVSFWPGETWHTDELDDSALFVTSDMGLDLFAHTLAALQTVALPSLEVVEAAGLDGTGRHGDGPVTWTQVVAAYATH